MHFMKMLTVYTLNSHVLTLKAHITKSCMFLLSPETFETSLTNSVDPDQTAPTLLASILMLNNKQTLSNVAILLGF